MHPFLWAEPYIGSYRVMLLLGFVGGFFLARWRTKRSGLEPRHIDNLVLLLMLVGPAGARLCSRLFYSHHPMSFWEALKLWEGGGLVFYGGAIAGFVAVLLYARIRKISSLFLMDVLAPSLAVGLVFGRIGCFLSGCCWGDVCASSEQLSQLAPMQRLQVQTFPALSPAQFPLAVEFPADSGAYNQHLKYGLIASGAAHSLPVHPTQVYEAVLALALCLFLNFRFNRKAQHGDIVWMFGLGYALLRFAVEFIRAESAQSYWGGLTFSQVVSLWIVLACLIGFYWTRFSAGFLSADRPKRAWLFLSRD